MRVSVLFAMALAACGQGEPVEPTSPAQPAPAAVPEVDDATPEPPRGPVRSGGPFVLEVADKGLLDAGVDIDVALLAKPTATLEKGRCTFAAGAPVPVQTRVRLVRQPPAFRVPVEVALPPDGTVDHGATRHLVEGRSGSGHAPGTVEAGQAVDWLLVLGDLDDDPAPDCLYRIDDHVVQTPCWDLELDVRPPEPEDWVQTLCEDSSGWLRVDDRDDLVAGS